MYSYKHTMVYKKTKDPVSLGYRVTTHEKTAKPRSSCSRVSHISLDAHRQKPEMARPRTLGRMTTHTHLTRSVSTIEIHDLTRSVIESDRLRSERHDREPALQIHEERSQSEQLSSVRRTEHGEREVLLDLITRSISSQIHETELHTSDPPIVRGEKFSGSTPALPVIASSSDRLCERHLIVDHHISPPIEERCICTLDHRSLLSSSSPHLTLHSISQLS